MTRAATLTLPWPPSVNGYWRSIVRGRGKAARPTQILSERARDYLQACAAAIYEQGHPPIFDTRVRITEHFYPPTKRGYDIDNYRKGYRDALVKCGVLADDELIYEDHGRKCSPAKGNGRIEITIERIDELPSECDLRTPTRRISARAR